MSDQDRPQAPVRGWRHRGAQLASRLRDPAVLALVAIAFLVSAVGNALVEEYLDEHLLATTVLFSILGSAFLVAAVTAGARRQDRPGGKRRTRH